MPRFPYVQSTTRLGNLFTELRGRGKPDKVTQKWLRGAGFTSSNDRAFIPLLRFLAIIDQNGVPTELYELLRKPDWRSELAGVVRSAYEDVFVAMPNAAERSRQELTNQFFALDSQATDETAPMMVSTFQGLVEFADFSATETGSGRVEQSEPQTVPEMTQPNGTTKRPGVALRINLSLELPATDKPEVYDALFKSMAEHLGELVWPNDD